MRIGENDGEPSVKEKEEWKRRKWKMLKSIHTGAKIFAYRC